jgi:cell division protein FtsZ
MKWLIQKQTLSLAQVIDERMQGELRITVIATGFTHEVRPQTVSKPTATRRVAAPSVGSPPPVAEPKNKPTGLDIPEFLQRRRPPR